MEFVGDLERAFASAIYPNLLLVGLVGVVILLGIFIRAWRHRWDLSARRHPRRTVAAALITAAVIGPLGWYLGSPLFLTTSIDEAPPVAGGQRSPSPSSRSADSTTKPSMGVPNPTPPGIERSGSFTGADEFHFGEGTARLIEAAPGQYTVRLEDFAVRNGPDLYVYLSPDPTGFAEDAIEIGRLKADRGNQNYPVPAGVDLANVESVIIWCKQFSELFATGGLS